MDCLRTGQVNPLLLRKRNSPCQNGITRKTTYSKGRFRLNNSQLAAIGQLQPSDLVWKEEMGQWTEARRIRGSSHADGGKPVVAATRACRRKFLVTNRRSHLRSAPPAATPSNSPALAKPLLCGFHKAGASPKAGELDGVAAGGADLTMGTAIGDGEKLASAGTGGGNDGFAAVCMGNSPFILRASVHWLISSFQTRSLGCNCPMAAELLSCSDETGPCCRLSFE